MVMYIDNITSRKGQQSPRKMKELVIKCKQIHQYNMCVDTTKYIILNMARRSRKQFFLDSHIKMNASTCLNTGTW